MGHLPASPLKRRPVPWYKRPWPYATGALLLGLLLIFYLAVLQYPWGITMTWAYWGGWLARLVGVNVDQWPYWSLTGSTRWLDRPWAYSGTWFNLAIIWGALLSGLLAREERLRLPRRWPVVLAALLGGLLMGYGARLAMGCNIGALLGGITSFSLHGWLFSAGLVAGSALGAWLLRRFL